MKSLFRRKLIISAGSLILVGVIFFSGIYLGYEHRPSIDKIVDVFNKQTPADLAGANSTSSTGVASADFKLFWDAWSVLNDKYVSPASTTPQQKVYGAKTRISIWTSGITKMIGNIDLLRKIWVNSF